MATARASGLCIPCQPCLPIVIRSYRAARADQRGQTLLSLPAMAVTVTLGAATSLLWAHAIHGTPKVSLSRSGQCTGQCTCDRVLSPNSWGITRASKESLWIALVFLFLARGC